MSLQVIFNDIYTEKGRLDPVEIEMDARDESHPLHGYLEWDDTEAARRFRIHQISKYLRSVHIQRETHTPRPRNVSVRAFFSTRDDRRYVPLDTLINEPQTIDHVREQMRRELRDLRSKYRAHEQIFEEVLQEAFALSA